MTINWIIFPAILFFFLFIKIGYVLSVRLNTVKAKSLLFIISFIAAIPGILFTLYYLHLFDNSEWFYNFRSVKFIELTAAGMGLLAGAFYGIICNKNKIYRILITVFLCVWIYIPYVKSVALPIPESDFSDNWSNNVCLQTTLSSCGPSCAATLLKDFGIDVSEKQLAKSCFTYQGGTEIWYIARVFRKYGFEVEFKKLSDLPSSLPAPSIAGVKIGKLGHFIPLIARKKDLYIVGDPLIGRKSYTKSELLKRYKFTGFYMMIKKK